MVKLELITGDLFLYQADVAVSAISSSKNLKDGNLSKQFLQHGGNDLQRELYSRNTGDALQPTEVVAIKPGNLKDNFKVLLFTYIPQYDPQKDDDTKVAVVNCLKSASDLSAKSIIFPCLGGGNIGLPEGKSTNALIESIAFFFLACPKSSIEKVLIFLYRKPSSDMKMWNTTFTDKIKEFNDFVQHAGLDCYINFKDIYGKQNSRAANLRTECQIMNDEEGVVYDDLEESTQPVAAAYDNEYGVDIGEINSGDHWIDGDGPPNIFLVTRVSGTLDPKADISVSTISPSKALKYGCLSRQFLQNGGTEIQGELDSINAGQNLMRAEVVATKPGKLKNNFKHLLFTYVPQYYLQRDNKDTRTAVSNCLKSASNHYAKSIIFPSLGAGKIKLPEEKSADALIGGIADFFRIWPNSSVENILISLYQKPLSTLEMWDSIFHVKIQEFNDCVKDAGLGCHISFKGIYGKQKGCPRNLNTLSGQAIPCGATSISLDQIHALDAEIRHQVPWLRDVIKLFQY